jgi:hypothetical protein
MLARKDVQVREQSEQAKHWLGNPSLSPWTSFSSLDVSCHRTSRPASFSSEAIPSKMHTPCSRSAAARSESFCGKGGWGSKWTLVTANGRRCQRGFLTVFRSSLWS